MPRSFVPCCVYACGLSALIFTYLVGYAVLDLFLARPYVLGTHTEAWMGWHAMGCLFVGIINGLAARWTDGRARRDVAAATALIFGVWMAQNAWLMTTGTFRPLMWINVVGCAIACGLSLRTFRTETNLGSNRLDRSPGAAT